MKARSFFLIVSVLYTVWGFSQTRRIDTMLIKADFSNETLEEVVRALESTYPIRFYYDPADTALLGKRFTGSFHDQNLSMVLNRIFSDTGYDFVYLPPCNIILIPGTAAFAQNGGQVDYAQDRVIGDKRDRGRYRSATINGTIRDGKTGEGQVGVVVYAQEAEKGTVSDLTGHYSITLIPGKHTLHFSSVGFENVEKEIELISSGKLDIDLFGESVAIGEVSVTRERPDRNISETQMGTIKISAKELKSIPSLMGEADLIKSMTLMPGVQTLGEASAGFNIRGGNIDQNLILVDGTSLFNTSHLFGFFSTIQPGVISDVTLYKGNIPASYGGRVSSVMDIRIGENQIDKAAVSAGIGLINARVNAELPLIRDKLSLVIGGRSTYSDWLLKLMPDPGLRESSAGYYDVIGKLKWQINRNNSFSLFAYQSYDRFDLSGNTRYNYGNRLGNFRYQHSFSPRLFLMVSGGYSRYELRTDSEKYPADPGSRRIDSEIDQYNTKINFRFIPGTKHRVDAGFEMNRTHIQPGEQNALTDQSIVATRALDPEEGRELAAYVSNNFDITRWLGIHAGIRYSYYTNLGPKTVYRYDENNSKSPHTIYDTLQYGMGEPINTYHYPEPRLMLRFTLNEKNSIKMGYTRSVQYIQLLSNTAAATPTDIWKLADTYVKPLTGDQVSLGFFRNFMDNTIETSVEAYYKKTDQLIDYKNGAVIVMNEFIESDIVSGKGKAYGVEVTVRKNTGNLTGWVGYTYSRTLRNTISPFAEDLVNGGEYYPAPYDKPHDISSSMNYQLSRRWSISANFLYSSGRPATLPEYQFEVDDRKLVYFSDRNKYRLPDYHRLDLSITFHGHLKADRKYISSWTFSVYNLYGRDNPYSVYYTRTRPTAANNYREYVLYKLSIVNRPIPTISYNFKF